MTESAPTLPGLSPLATLTVEVGTPIVVQAGAPGRRFIPITGGRIAFTRPDLRDVHGAVLAGGGDWQDVTADGLLIIDAHYVVEVAGHGTVEIRSTGLRDGPPGVLAAVARGEAVDPGQYYFRTAIRFTTSAPGLAGLNRRLAIATGSRTPTAVQLAVFDVE